MIKNTKSSLGLTIPNPDLNFKCKRAKLIDDMLFVITNSDEILTYIKKEDKINNVSYFDKKYLILSNLQEREKIVDLFIMKKGNEILSQNEKIIIVISENLTIYYHNIADGLCISKINLSAFLDDEIIYACPMYQRFIMILFKRKLILFDTFTSIIFKEEQMKILSKFTTDNEKEKFESFEVSKIIQVKETSFFILNQLNETIYLSINNLSQISQLDIDYEKSRIKLIKQTFNIDKFINEESMWNMVYNQEFFFHNYGQKLCISFLDSVEELTELTSQMSKVRFPIIYINNIFINNDERLLVLYKDLTCELLYYDKKLRELKPEKKFVIMIEDEFINMKYLTGNNVLIGYTKNTIHVFDLRRFNKNDEKYADRVIDLEDVFNLKKKKNIKTKIFFTNYFSANFSKFVNYSSKQLSKKNIMKKQKKRTREIEIENNNYNENISNTNASTPSNKNDNNNLFKNNSYKITASAIFSFSENKSIYYIIGTDTGKIALIDIFFTENLTLNPFIIIDYHQAPIESFNIFDNRLLIACSTDGTMSFTDICIQKLESAIKTTLDKMKYVDDQNLNNMIRKNSSQLSRKNSAEDYNQQFNLSYLKQAQSAYEHLGGVRRNSKLNLNKFAVKEEEMNHCTLLPCYSIKCFNKLKRILPVIQIENNYAAYSYLTEETKKKNNSLLGFVMESNETIIIRMDTFDTIYRFNQITSNNHIEAIYHIATQKILVFYLSNNSIKVSNYSSRICDRYITNIDTIYKILHVSEKMNQFFLNANKLDEYISNISIKKLRFDENDLEDKKKDKNYYKYGERNRHNSIENREDFKDNDKISILYIKKKITDKKERELFIKKLYENSMKNCQSLNISKNSFDAAWMRKVENFVIDKMIEIINSTLPDELKKIKIMNLLYNPQLFMPSGGNNNSIYDGDGININIMKAGEQYNQFISFNFDEYFSFIDRKINEIKNSKVPFRVNYFNFISLFHIWNFALDLDSYLYKYYKLYQPIFNFFPVLFGVDCTSSLILEEEAKIDENINFSLKFTEHFKYFQNYIKKPHHEKDSKNNSKKDLFLDKNLLLDTQKGYLVNFKNYRISQNLSHHLHVGLFGALIGVLGYEENSRLCDFMDSEKKILKILAIKNNIEYSNFEMFHQFMFENNDDFNIVNNNLLINDYLNMEFNIANKPKYDLSTRMKFKLTMDNIMLYINQIYKFIFNITGEDKDGLYNDFNKLNKDLNINTGKKIAFLSKYELSLIYFILFYNFLNTKINVTLPDNIAKKSTQLLVLFVFRIINNPNKEINVSKNVVTLIEKCTDILENVYKDNLANYAKILLEFYTSLNIPINLESLFKKYDIGSYVIIKSDENTNFLKVVIAKYIKNFSKTKLSHILKVMVDEFKNKTVQNPMFYSYLIEMLWILFKDRSYRLVQYLPNVINLVMSAMFPTSKELKAICAENCKKILASLILYYPMIAFHPSSQKLAVGANDGKIFIYDMTNGNIWKNLSAHGSEITAIIFDQAGNSIISYSSTERLVKCWKIGLTNFFSNFFTKEDGYYHQIKMKKIDENISNDEKLQNVKFQLLKRENEVMLIRENRAVDVLKI